MPHTLSDACQGECGLKPATTFTYRTPLSIFCLCDLPHPDISRMAISINESVLQHRLICYGWLYSLLYGRAVGIRWRALLPWAAGSDSSVHRRRQGDSSHKV